MKNKKIIIITSALAIGIPLFAISTQMILEKAREDYYKAQKQQIEAEKAKEKAEREQRLAQERAERERQIQQEKEERQKRITEEKNERKQKIIEQKLQREQDKQDKKEKVKITNASPVFAPEPEAAVKEKPELTPEEIKKAKKALKEARASYLSGNKAAIPSKIPRNTDKIIIKSDKKGNVEAIRRSKEENEKAKRILKEIRDSYYKNNKK